MPIMTQRSTAEWDSGTVYPVNALEFDPERCDSIPGVNFVGAPWPSGDRPGGRWGSALLQMDLTSALSTSTHMAKTLFKACGMDYTGVGPIFLLGDPHFSSGDVYAGAVTPVGTLTIDVDGTGSTTDSWSTSILNCVGGSTLTLMPGEVPQLEFAMVGQINPALASVAATAQATVAGQWGATTITSPGTAVRYTPGLLTNTLYTGASLLEAKISTNPVIAMRKGLGTSTVAGHGYFAPAITGYRPQIDCVVEVPSIDASTNPKPVFLGQTVGNWGLQHTFSTGNSLTILATNWVISAMPQAVERDGILTQALTLKPARTAVVASGLKYTFAYT